MTGRNREELIDELREYGFDEQAALLAEKNEEEQGEPQLTPEQDLRRALRDVATSKRTTREVDSLGSVIRGDKSKGRRGKSKEEQ